MLKQPTPTFFKTPWSCKKETQPQALSDIDLNNPGHCDKSATEIAKMIRPALKDHLKRTAYDMTGYIEAAIEADDSNYTFDSFATIQKYNGSNCIGLSLSLLTDIVFKFFGKTPPIYVIPSTLPEYFGLPKGAFGHAALLMVCRDGLILLESGFHVQEPIVLHKKEAQTLLVGGDTLWRFYWDGGDSIKTTFVSEKYGEERFEYTLKHISNPDAAITQSSLLTGERQRLSFVIRNSEGKQIKYATINRTKQQVEAFDLESQERLTLPFSELNIEELSQTLSFLSDDVILRIKRILKSLLNETTPSKNLPLSLSN